MKRNQNLDLFPILNGWNYNRYRISTRTINTAEGKKKLQLRIDLGLLQMELDGRPDGKRPYGQSSLLDYFKHRLQNYKRSGKKFALSGQNCDALRQEAIQYYHRYLAFYHMENYDSVIRDTRHNIEIFEMIEKYAEDDEDYIYFLQFYPLVLFIHAKAIALKAIKNGEKSIALDAIDNTVQIITNFLKENEIDKFIEESPEILSLAELRKSILEDTKEPSEFDKLHEKLRRAIAFENYEEAAIIRDKIRIIKKSNKREKYPN